MKPIDLDQATADFNAGFSRFCGTPYTAESAKTYFFKTLDIVDRTNIIVAAEERMPTQFDKAQSLAILTVLAAQEFAELQNYDSPFCRALTDRTTRGELLARCVPHVHELHAVKQWMAQGDTHKYLKPGIYLPGSDTNSKRER